MRISPYVIERWQIMTKQSPEVTAEFLQAFANAWNRHDVDDLMSFMTDDCVFETSAGDQVWGSRYEGVDAVRAGFS
jgi:ketosteroid isomerase-like protein